MDELLALTITMIDKVTIRKQWLGVFLRVMSDISWNFGVDDLTELPKLFDSLSFLTELGQQNILIRLKGHMQATALDQSVYGVWV